jgi:hypothetical protein
LNAGYDSLKIYLKNDRLYSTYPPRELGETPLIASGNNQFKSQPKGRYRVGYEFLVDEKGNIKCLNLGQPMWLKQ